MKIGARLRYWRENRNFTYYRVAQESGIDADYIKKIEESTQDNEPNIKIETLDKLARALGVPPSDLINENAEAMCLAADERNLITIYRRLSDKERKAFVNVMDVVSNRQA